MLELDDGKEAFERMDASRGSREREKSQFETRAPFEHSSRFEIEGSCFEVLESSNVRTRQDATSSKWWTVFEADTVRRVLVTGCSPVADQRVSSSEKVLNGEQIAARRALGTSSFRDGH